MHLWKVSWGCWGFFGGGTYGCVVDEVRGFGGVVVVGVIWVFGRS